MGNFQKGLEVVECSVAGMNRAVVGDVVSVIAQGRREKRHQPDGSNAKVGQVINLLRQPAKVSNTVAIASKNVRTCT